ncbi:MAG: hypothetical protein JXB00_01910 [Bacteroidales bacterium]|nr:hypothetical protein [Bacteroidales bacterium]
MKTRIYPVFLLVLITTAGCFEDTIENISDSVLINSSYSLPVGEVTYQVNDYFEALGSFNIPWPDSVAYNDIVYPNYTDIVEKTDIKQFDFANLGGNIEKIKSITLRIIIENGYPTEARAQVYFTNYFSLYDPLFPAGVETIPPATVDQNGIVTQPYTVIKDILLDEYMLENLTGYTNIEIIGQVATKKPDTRIVKFYTDYKLKIHIGLRAELEFNLNEL